jgi:heme exporter protein B
LRTVSAIVWKDLAAEMRSRELLGAMLVFALLVILIFNFALELDIRTRETITSGVLWVTFSFSGIVGFSGVAAFLAVGEPPNVTRMRLGSTPPRASPVEGEGIS